jgi:alpha-L-fucosidase
MPDQSNNYLKRIEWFNQARFGIVIHFGLYSLLERGEWVKLVERIPNGEYAELASRFNPQTFDAEAWVMQAKNAGAKYMVLTARHHDGFCLYDSHVSEYTSVKTSARRDFVAEYIQACRKHGLRVGLYYSLLDWRFPGYFFKDLYPDDFKKMVRQAHDQVRELMTCYGKIDMLWFDGPFIPEHSPGNWFDPARPFSIRHCYPAEKWAGFWRADELNSMVRALQPDIMINDRSGLPGDFDTPEQYVRASETGRAWESCMTMGDFLGWGYVKNNPSFKTPAQLIQYLVAAASGCGNYLLNIGPKADGTIRDEEIDRLTAIGRWMEVNGKSIYYSEPCPFSAGMLGLATAKGHQAFLHIFHWPGEQACIAGVGQSIESAYILPTRQNLDFSFLPNGRLVLSGLPQDPPDEFDSVIVLNFKNKPEAC